jgi:RNase P subunit RPR2
MKFAVFRLIGGERLTCNECNTIVKGGKGVKVYFREAARSDAPAIDKVMCPKCMQKLKDETEGTDIKIIVVNEESP